MPTWKQLADALEAIVTRIKVFTEEQGTYFPFSKTATAEGELDIRAPATGKKMQILSFFYYCKDDIVTELRWKTSGNLVAGMPSKGVVGMNNLHRAPPEGATDEVLTLYFSGAGTAKGWIIYRDV